MATVSADISANNEGTDWLPLRRSGLNYYTVRFKGTFAGSVRLEVKKDGEPDGDRVGLETYTTDVVETRSIAGPWVVRLQVIDYTSGTMELDIYTDE